jgi:LysM repeat protein
MILILLLALVACVQEGEDVLLDEDDQPIGEIVLEATEAPAGEDGQTDATVEEGTGEAVEEEPATGATEEGTAPAEGETVAPAGEEGEVESGGGIGEEPQEGEGGTVPSTPSAGEVTVEAESAGTEGQPTVVAIDDGSTEAASEATPEPTVDAQAQSGTGSPATQTYTVQAGDTLFSIATQFNTTVEQLRELNNLETNFVTVGQELVVPSETAAAPEESAEAPTEEATEAPVEGQSEAAPTPNAEGFIIHVVAGGEWIYSIARLYNVTPEAILAANPVLGGNPNLIYPGQELRIPVGGAQAPVEGQSAAPRTITVQVGSTLTSIAAQCGTTVDALKQANNLVSDIIYIGQTLVCP